MKSDNGNLSRREALGALAGLGLFALSGSSALAAAGKKRGKRNAAAPVARKGGIALQMYTMREPAKKDLADTLKKCREMGWQNVQWSGMPNLPAEKIREALDAAGLKCIAAHIAIEDFEKDFDANVKFWKTVGANDIAPGGMMKDCKESLEAWKNGCKRLDTVGAKLRDVGMRLSYHNHSWEFEKFPGDDRPKLEILLQSTTNVNSELDVAWAYHAGVDPAAFIRKYKGRCPTLHIKDGVNKEKNKFEFKPLGQGEVKLLDVFAAGRETGAEWYIYEQDGGQGSPFDYAKVSYEFMKKNFP
jgi:sugar phosphate isomerase/epimerase